VFFIRAIKVSGGDLYFDQTFISLLDFVTTPTLRGAIALLDKYVEIIQAHVMQALSLACDVATADACHFSRISSTPRTRNSWYAACLFPWFIFIVLCCRSAFARACSWFDAITDQSCSCDGYY